MTSPVIGRTLDRDAIVRGAGRRLLVSPHEYPGGRAPRDDERQGFELGYSDGLRAAREELERSFDDAKQCWLAEAEAEREKALEELEAARAALMAAAQSFESEAAADARRAEGDAVELASRMMIALFGRKAADGSLLADLLHTALATKPAAPLQVRVATADLVSFQQHEQLIRVVADSSLPLCSCVIDTPRGQLDAGVRARLALMVEAFVRTLESAPHGAG